VTSQQVGDILGRAISDAKPNDLRRCAAQHAQTMEVLVLRDQDTVIFARQAPDVTVCCTALPKEAHMQRVRKQICHRRNQGLGQLLVEEKSHGSRGWQAQRPTLPLCRVGQARSDVVTGQLRKIPKNVILGHAASKIPEHVSDRDAGAPYAGLAKPHFRIDRDTFQRTHRTSLRQPGVISVDPASPSVLRICRPNVAASAAAAQDRTGRRRLQAVFGGLS